VAGTFALLAASTGLVGCAHDSVSDPDYRTTSQNLLVASSFDETMGFVFDNNHFVNVFADIRTEALCGGMSYAALDYFHSGVPIPQQWYAPANGTTLYNYLYQRQVSSILDNADDWAEYNFNPDGIRNSEFFKRGLNEEFEHLKARLPANPVPLGLKGKSVGDHQVIAYAYDAGSYAGGLGPNQEDLRIFVLDPNYPGEENVLVPDLSGEFWTYEGKPHLQYQAYFVDTSYSPHNPPVINEPTFPDDGKIHQLVLELFTGDDDLRGQNDNLNVTLNLSNREKLHFDNVNGSAKWAHHAEEWLLLELPRPLDPSELISITLEDTFNGDNWDMTRLQLYAQDGGGPWALLASPAGFRRFTSQDDPHTVQLFEPSGLVTRLQFHFKTHEDDLRGGNDNINLTIGFADGSEQFVGNINGGRGYPKWTQSTELVFLDEPIEACQIDKLTLQTTFAGGSFSDNWDMGEVEITALGDGVNEVIATNGFNRFTGSDGRLNLEVADLACYVPEESVVIDKLELTFDTGNDDLRGGNDNVNVSVGFEGGGTQSWSSVNGGSRWEDQSNHVVTLNLTSPIEACQLATLGISTTFTGGIAGDNWNMEHVSVRALGPDGVNIALGAHGFKRFTGDDHNLSFAIDGGACAVEPDPVEPKICTPGDQAFCNWMGACNAAGTSCECSDPVHWYASENCSTWHEGLPTTPGDLCTPGDREACNWLGTCSADGTSCNCDDSEHFWSSDDCATWHPGPDVVEGSVCTPGDRADCHWMGTCNELGTACECDEPAHWWASDLCSVWHP
jgi:hypothetical protein